MEHATTANYATKDRVRLGILAGYLPDVARDVVEPLTTAGYGPDAIAALGPVGRPGS
jgi:hypothetical protein